MGIPTNRLPLIFVTKIWKMGKKGLYIKIPKEIEEIAKSWEKEEIYVLLLPVSELVRQKVIVKTAKTAGDEHGD